MTPVSRFLTAFAAAVLALSLASGVAAAEDDKIKPEERAQFDKRMFGTFISDCEALGFDATLTKRLRDFNQARIDGIHKYLLGLLVHGDTLCHILFSTRGFQDLIELGVGISAVVLG